METDLDVQTTYFSVAHMLVIYTFLVIKPHNHLNSSGGPMYQILEYIKKKLEIF